MNLQEAARILAMAASVDHRVPPLNPTGPDERVPAWHMVLADLDYRTAEQGLLEVARNPGLVAIRPGDIYQATKAVMRRNLATVDLDTLEPPDDMTVQQYLGWRKALVRAVGRGTPVRDAVREADATAGAERRRLEPARPRNLRALIEARPAESPSKTRRERPDRAEIEAELEQMGGAS